VEGTKRQLAAYAVSFPFVLILSFLTQLSIPFRVDPTLVGIYSVVLSYAVIALPFAVSGVVVCLVLTRFPAETGRLYAYDLLGAAMGCGLLVAALELTDGPGAVLFVAWLASLGGVAFAWNDPRRRLRRLASVSSALFLAAAVAHPLLARRGRTVLRILYVKGGYEPRPLYERWNSYSRVRVEGDPASLQRPSAWGLSSAYPTARRVHQLAMNIDATAGTVLTRWTGDPAEVEHLRHDVTNVGYYIVPRPRALVVGTGGGRDVLSALTFGARSVVGVELNPNILKAVNGRFGEFTGHLDRDPRVRFVSDEARSYLARSGEEFDFIQISLIDTWAATAAGAFVLSENSLYTVEAWQRFIGRLSSQGVLSVSRWYFEGRPAEVHRLTAIGVAALRSLGVVEPRRHLIVVRNSVENVDGQWPDGVGTLLLSRSPFPRSVVARIAEVSRDLHFQVMLDPDHAADATLAALVTEESLEAVASRSPLNIAPPTDDSPFFFNMLRPRDLLRLDLLATGQSSHNLEAVFVLGVLLLAVFLLTGLCIFVPLLVASDRRVLVGARSHLAYFAMIGFGFMLVEISQMQRLIVMLGHPTYALTVVLFATLLSSAAGSATTERLVGSAGGARLLAPLIALVALLAAYGLSTPVLLRAVEAWTTPGRIAVAVLMLSPLGFFMGTAFPLGMKLASASVPGLTPWLWGVNGAASVCASVLAIVVALGSSITMTLWCGLFCYAGALAVLPRIAGMAKRHESSLDGSAGTQLQAVVRHRS
jgi:hypothetical protein